ncbi:hypothetical protein HC031_29480 [Planosporangium thailandense]|uniref:Uncharacterized protein n=1 Tax=Planosporangium thailandense TaxID=765197 RepID=A0ABX0Y5W9_9ACTN|nr:hypothetical protein [Planosporangium thailandense]NJC73815.1 hypothetical protein [Planosporangium thailandense]
MEPVKRWWRWLAAAAGTIVTSWLMPAAAWAQAGPGTRLVGDELARRSRQSPSGLLAGCCCLMVVLVIVLIVMQFRRLRRRRNTDTTSQGPP